MASRFRQVSWVLPEPLYQLLEDLQTRLVDSATRTPVWPSVEALAVHFLRVAVREAHKEIATNAVHERLVKLPGEV